jgi:hypothetical protein
VVEGKEEDLVVDARASFKIHDRLAGDALGSLPLRASGLEE